jgi:hypothetical protein
VDHQADWLHLKLTGEPPQTLLLPDPLSAHDDAAEALIGALEAMADTAPTARAQSRPIL